MYDGLLCKWVWSKWVWFHWRTEYGDEEKQEILCLTDEESQSIICWFSIPLGGVTVRAVRAVCVRGEV